MIRALVISLAVAALAVSAAPLASAATTPPQVIVLIGANDYGVVTSGTAKAKGPRSGSFVDIGTTETLDMPAVRKPKPRRTATSASFFGGLGNDALDIRYLGTPDAPLFGVRS